MDGIQQRSESGGYKKFDKMMMLFSPREKLNPKQIQ